MYDDVFFGGAANSSAAIDTLATPLDLGLENNWSKQNCCRRVADLRQLCDFIQLPTEIKLDPRGNMRPQTSSSSSFSSLSGASIKSVGTVCISILALYCSQQQDAASTHAQNQNQSNVFTFNKLKSDMDLPRNGSVLYAQNM